MPRIVLIEKKENCQLKENIELFCWVGRENFIYVLHPVRFGENREEGNLLYYLTRKNSLCDFLLMGNGTHGPE